jgi:hypothetical protein
MHSLFNIPLQQRIVVVPCNRNNGRWIHDIRKRSDVLHFILGEYGTPQTLSGWKPNAPFQIVVEFLIEINGVPAQRLICKPLVNVANNNIYLHLVATSKKYLGSIA